LHLFLDTNTYLGFFRLSDDDLEQLKKLSDRVGSGETTLYVTEQVRAEFMRHREGAIDEALDTVRKVRLPSQFAPLVRALDGYEDVRTALDDAEEKLRKLKEDALKAVEDGSLHADELINDLFARGKSVALTDAIFVAAKRRVTLGNPPGKTGSYGDAINWESLLAEVPNRENLVLVTRDNDFGSKLDPHKLQQYLREEWANRKGSEIDLHRTLRSALEAHYPEILLAKPEPEPELLQAVAQLVDASNFAETHRAIRGLSRFAEFDPDQVAALVEAADNNSQIRGIMQDDDVFVFYQDLARRYGSVMESHLWEQLVEQLEDAEIYRSRLA
jgi:predicted nucleic acid-binding protein